MNLWVWDSPGLSISKGEPLIKVWAVFETSNIRSNILGLDKRLLLVLLVKSIFRVAVVTWLWVWDTKSLSVGKSESFIKVWAVFETSNIRSNIFLLAHHIILLAVIVEIWVWNGSGLSVSEGESFIKVRAVLKRIV